MKFSKRYFIKRTIQDLNVEKTVEAIMLTNHLTQERNLAVKAFESEFSKEICKIFLKYLLDLGNNKDLDCNVKIPSKGIESLLKFQGTSWQLENLLLQEDVLVFEIIYNQQTLIILKYFDVDNKDKSIILDCEIYFSNNKENNKIIYEIFKLFEKISLN